LPEALLPYLEPGDTALDIGCNAGGVALFLAARGVNVVGIDINANAVLTAREQAERKGLAGAAQFEVSDVLTHQQSREFDIVLMTRVLTCFSDQTIWDKLLRRAYSFLRPGGLIYIHDFVHSPEIEQYRHRYNASAARGWRLGNFPVPGPAGELLFVAHHHTAAEIDQIRKPYETLRLDLHDSISMNGNRCKMFELIARKGPLGGNVT
jgi:cyclopropane fatty-acyl-phospholipid synthase-like methyltransferase